MIEIVRKSVEEFCRAFYVDPYLCYTEHGLHARFYSLLYGQVQPDAARYTVCRGRRVCVLQKEYPTASDLDKPRRQHWDVAVIKPEQPDVPYDYMRLTAVVEFGMNEDREHLRDDIERVCHADANVEHGFIAHLYRLSDPLPKFSGRDWSFNSTRIVTPAMIAEMSRDKQTAAGNPLEIFYVVTGEVGTVPRGIWRIVASEVERLEVARGETADHPQ